MTIRVPGEGDVPVAGKGPKGDLLLRVSVAPSKVFRRQGTNIHHEARIPMHTALLGGRVRVPTLDGDVDVSVPGGTQPGEEMVLNGRGLPAIFGGDRGDLFISFMVQLPRCVSRYIHIARADWDVSVQVPHEAPTGAIAVVCRRCGRSNVTIKHPRGSRKWVESSG